MRSNEEDEGFPDPSTRSTGPRPLFSVRPTARLEPVGNCLLDVNGNNISGFYSQLIKTGCQNTKDCDDRTRHEQMAPSSSKESSKESSRGIESDDEGTFQLGFQNFKIWFRTMHLIDTELQEAWKF